MVKISTFLQAATWLASANGAVHRLPLRNVNAQIEKRVTGESLVSSGNYTADPDSIMNVDYTFNNLATQYLANQNNVTTQLVGFSTLLTAITHDAAGMVLEEIAQNQETFFNTLNSSASSDPTITPIAWEYLGQNVTTFVNAASTWSDSVTPNNTILVNAIYAYITNLQQWGGMVFNSTTSTAAAYAPTTSATSAPSTIVSAPAVTSAPSALSTSSAGLTTLLITASTEARETTDGYVIPSATTTVAMTPVPTTSSTSVPPPPPPPTTTSSAAPAPSAPAATGLAVYWGNTKQTKTHGLAEVCADDKVDIVIVNFAANVTGGFGDWGANPTLAELTACQTTQKKKMFISIGGWTTDLNTLATAADGETHAQLIWDLYGGGSSSDRDTLALGSFVFDGFDLDIEHLPGDGTQTNLISQTVPIWPAFLQKLRDLSNADTSRKYYLSGAPYGSWLDVGADQVVLNQDSYKLMDYVWPQFYVGTTGDHGGPDFGTNVGNWASMLHDANPAAKLYIGTPSSEEAVAYGGKAPGWVFDTVQPALDNDVKAAVAAAKQYGNLGGYMLWDGSEAIANNNFQDAVKQAIIDASS